MSTIDFSTITFNGQEVSSLREAFYQAVFQNPAIDQFHTVVTGIKAKQQILHMGQYGLMGKKIDATCDITPSTAILPVNQKYWTPVFIGDRVEQCYTDLLNTFFVWGLKNGVHKADLTNTDFALFLEERLSLAAYETALRFAWLGNTAAALQPAGYLATTVDLGYYNAMNGFWNQATAIAVADASKHITISRNAGSSYSTQQFTSADTDAKVVTTMFESMIYGADLRLRGAKDKVIVATQSVVDQYARERKAASAIELAYERTESGIDTFKIDGIEVIPFQFLDRHIRQYENNGTAWNQPHRALFTTKSNLQIGTEEVSNFNELDPFYDPKSRLYIVDYSFHLDAKIAEDNLVMVAY